MRQLNLFDHPPPPVELNSTVLPADVPRLQGQHKKILAMLRERDHSNIELMAAFGPRVGARCHELKKAGFNVVCERLTGGIWFYRLRD